jgi:hypothetical protein
METTVENNRVVLSVSFNLAEWKELQEKMDAEGANDTPKTHVSTYVKQQIFGKT